MGWVQWAHLRQLLAIYALDLKYILTCQQSIFEGEAQRQIQ